jgi:hypothetical protein
VYKRRLFGAAFSTSLSMTPFQCRWRTAEAEAVADDWLKVVLHQPFLYEGALRKCAPYLFKRMWHLPLHDDGTRLP